MPNFSVQVYFLIMFVILIISTCSFTFLNFSKIDKHARKPNAILISEMTKNTHKNKVFENSDNNINTVSIFAEDKISSGTTTKLKHANIGNCNVVIDSTITDRPLNQLDFSEKRELAILLSLIFMMSFICYGILPGLQPYSTLPYGNDIYSYAVNLSK